MAARTGLQAFVRLCHRVCKLLATWQASIIAAINASTLTAEQKTEVIAVVNSINAACDLMVQLTTRYEL